jgi:hypothetical protein
LRPGQGSGAAVSWDLVAPAKRHRRPLTTSPTSRSSERSRSSRPRRQRAGRSVPGPLSADDGPPCDCGVRVPKDGA